MLTEEKLKEFQANFEKSMSETLQKDIPELMTKEFEDKFDAEIKTKIDEAVKAAGLDQLPIFSKGKEEVDSKTSKENALKFFKAVFSKDVATLNEMGASFKAMAENVDSAGGYLVPEETMAQLDRVADDYGLIRKLSRIIPMGRDTMNMPTLGTKPNVYWPGEGGVGTESQPVIKNVKLQARTAVGLTPISNELMADANIGVVEMLVDLFAEQLAGEEDNQGLNGTGLPFTGILNSTEVNVSTAATGHNTLAEVDLDDLEDAIANIKSTVLGGCVWVFHRQVWSTLKKIKQNSQSLVAFNTTDLISMKTTGGNLVPAGMLLGYPVYLSDKMPNTPAATEAYGIFGNFSKFYFGNRQQVAISVSDSATIGGVNMFETNSQAVRVLERVALAVGVGEAFNVLKLAA